MPEEENKEDIVEDPDKEETTDEEEEEEETPEQKAQKEKEREDESPEDKEKREAAEKKAEEEAGGEDDKSKRTPRTMELWKHNIAEKKWNKERAELQDKVLALSSKVESKPEPERAKLIKDFAEKSGMDSALIEEFVKIANSGQSNLSKEFSDLKAQVKKNDEERVEAQQNREFEKDYEKNITPLIEADQIPKENIARLKKLLKSFAFNEEFARTRLSVIYKGHDDFRQFSKKGQKSGESSRGGMRGEEDDKKGYLDMTAEQFEKSIKDEADKAGEGRVNIRRDGKTIKD